jgi:hypothetical protein
VVRTEKRREERTSFFVRLSQNLKRLHRRSKASSEVLVPGFGEVLPHRAIEVVTADCRALVGGRRVGGFRVEEGFCEVARAFEAEVDARGRRGQWRGRRGTERGVNSQMVDESSDAVGAAEPVLCPAGDDRESRARKR